MKIMFDHQIFGMQKYGGISRYFYELANHLVSQVQDVEIFAPLYVNEYFSATDKIRPKGFKIPQFPRSRRIVEMANSLATRFWVNSSKSVDVYHETYYSSKSHAPFSAKRVLTVFDMIHERLPDDFVKDDKLYEAKAGAIRRADQVICISEYTRRDLIEILEVEPSKISVIHLGFGLPQDMPGNEVAQTGASRAFILYVGLRAGYKNFDRLAIAYASSAKLMGSFDLVCFGGGKFTAKEMARFQALGIPCDSIRHVAGDDQALGDCYRSASAFVYPSLYEGFGLPPLEAMSFDCPVICSNVTSIPEIVGDAAVLFDPRDVEAIRTAIERVLDDEAMQTHLIATGRERVGLFSWERCAKETLAAYSHA